MPKSPAKSKPESGAHRRLPPEALNAPLLPARRHELFKFMRARESLRCKKATGAPPPWSDDDILNVYKFTNVKREHDRTTEWMRQHFTANAATASAGVAVFNCALFRMFGTCELAATVGWTTSYDAAAVVRAALDCRRQHGHAFTSAYCLPNHNAEVRTEAGAERAYEKLCGKYLQAASTPPPPGLSLPRTTHPRAAGRVGEARRARWSVPCRLVARARRCAARDAGAGRLWLPRQGGGARRDADAAHAPLRRPQRVVPDRPGRCAPPHERTCRLRRADPAALWSVRSQRGAASTGCTAGPQAKRSVSSAARARRALTTAPRHGTQR